MLDNNNPASDSTIYRLLFVHHNKIIEMYVEHIYQSDMFGFIEVAGFVFNRGQGVLVNPAEESLRQEFAKVKRSFIPLQSVLRIDEVSEQGDFRVVEFKKENARQSANLFPFAQHFSRHPDSDSD